MSVLENLNKIKSCKEDIKQAIIDKGVDMTNVVFTEYATKISEIQAGGGDYLDMRANMSTYYSTVELVPGYAFIYCSSLASVNLPMCSYVSESAFAHCSSLQSIDLPNCISVSGHAFAYCSSLQSIDLHNCTRFAYNVFTSCKSLQSVNLPMCSYVSDYVFAHCTSLQSVNLPMCNHIGSYAFSSCASLSVLDLRSTYSCSLPYSNTFSKTPFASGVGSIYVHNTLLSQFQTATNWTYFSKCFVGVGDPTKPLLSFDDGKVYGDTYGLYRSWTSVLGVVSSSVISIDLPNVKNLSTSAGFSNFYNLTSVSMNNLVSAPNEMCYNCPSLQSIDLPNCSYVGSSAFRSCSSLQSVNLPMCSYVGNNVFVSCKSLQSIDLPNCNHIGIYVFNNCTSLQSVNLPMCSYVGNDAFSNCPSLQSIDLPNCSYIGSYAFSYCYNMTKITVGTSISVVCDIFGTTLPRTNIGGTPLQSIIVPMSLVDAYKSAQYWSDYASLIYGI